MPAASAIGSGLAFGATNAAANILTEEGVNKLISGLGGLFKSDAMREIVQSAMGAMKQQLPKAFGIGHVEEAEFYNALSRLSQDDQNRVKRVVAELRKGSIKHLQRWWMILATKKIEGVEWDPDGPVIVPGSSDHGKATDVWGVPKARASARQRGPGPVENTPADPRIMALQAIADKVRQPHGPDGTGELFDRNGKRLRKIRGDSQRAVEEAAEFLRINILEDYHFYSWLVLWFKSWHERDPNRLSKLKTYLKDQTLSLTLWWIGSEIGHDALREILADDTLDEQQKTRAIETALQEVFERKLAALKRRRGLPWRFWYMIGGLAGIILLASLIISLGQSITH